VKIQEPLYQAFDLNNRGLTKKVSTPLLGQSENVNGPYTFGREYSQIEKEVFQVLKAITSEFKNAIDMLSGDDQNILFTDVGIKLPEKPQTPVSEHDVLLLFLSGKGEIPEDPAKIFLSYMADKSALELPVSPQFVGKIVEDVKLFVNVLAGKGLVATQDTNEDGAKTGSESGYVIKLSHLPHVSGEESTMMPQLITAPSAQTNGVTQVPESIITYQVSGKAVDSQYLSFLSLQTGEESEIFKKLQVLMSDIQTDTNQSEGGEADGIPRENRTVEQIGNVENTAELKRMRIDQPFQYVHEESSPVIVSLDMTEDKDEITPVRIIHGKNANGLTGDSEGELKGTTLNTGFGQGELKSSPMAGFPLLPFDNDMIVGKAVRFVDQLNTLLSGDGTVDEVLDETVPDGTVPSRVSLEKLRLLQTSSSEIRTAIQSAARKVISEFENISNTESIGLSRGKNGSLHLDTSILLSQLTSGKEEAVNVMKGFGNAIYERINYLIHPYAGIYIDDKNILQLRATQKDEGASLFDKESKKEQNSLEKRLNELKLLIDRSRLLTEWFTQNSSMFPNDLKEAGGVT
jgi:hypothetical protein